MSQIKLDREAVESVIHNVFYKNVDEIRVAVQWFIQYINKRPFEVIQRLCKKM